MRCYSVVFIFLFLVACKKEKGSSSSDLEVDGYQGVLIGHWESVCYSDSRAIQWKKDEYIFYADEFSETTKSYEDEYCESEIVNVVVINGEPVQDGEDRIPYKFVGNAVENSGLTYSKYKASFMLAGDAGEQIIIGEEWEFGLFIESGVFYRVLPDFENGSGSKIDYDLPFYKKI